MESCKSRWCNYTCIHIYCHFDVWNLLTRVKGNCCKGNCWQELKATYIPAMIMMNYMPYTNWLFTYARMTKEKSYYVHIGFKWTLTYTTCLILNFATQVVWVFFKNSVKDISLYLIIQPAIVFFLSQFYNDENRLLYYLRLCSSMSLSISPNSCERVQFSNVRSVIWDVHVAQWSKRRIKVQGLRWLEGASVAQSSKYGGPQGSPLLRTDT